MQAGRNLLKRMYAAMSYIYIFCFFVCLLACFWQTIAGVASSRQSLTKDVMESDRQMVLLTPSPLSGISQNCDQRFRLEHTCQVIFHKELCVVALCLHGFLPQSVGIASASKRWIWSPGTTWRLAAVSQMYNSLHMSPIKYVKIRSQEEQEKGRLNKYFRRNNISWSLTEISGFWLNPRVDVSSLARPLVYCSSRSPHTDVLKYNAEKLPHCAKFPLLPMYTMVHLQCTSGKA